MTPAQRLARLPGCWRPGTLGVFAPGVAQVGWIRILRVGPDGAVYSWVDDGGWINTAIDGAADLAEYVPGLDDAATVGCLAAWAREVYGDPNLHAAPTGARWQIRTGGWRRRPAVAEDITEGDAWAAAILAKLEQR